MKPWWKSKTIWFNVLAALFALLESQAGLLQQAVAAVGFANAYPVIALVVMFVNLWLRIVTDKTITR